MRTGIVDTLGLLVGVVPFGIVFGAAAADAGFGVSGASGFSVLIFAGASQLAALDVLHGGGSWLVAATAAWVVNLRLLLYSASLAPHMAHLPLRTRLAAAYLLTDQAYAVTISRVGRRWPRETVLPLYLASGLSLWVTWQVSVLAGALFGRLVPASVPLGFAVPLVFLGLLIGAVTDASTAVAAVVGGGVAVVAGSAGIGDLSLLVGALAGIGAGTAHETLRARGHPDGGRGPDR